MDPSKLWLDARGEKARADGSAIEAPPVLPSGRVGAERYREGLAIKCFLLSLRSCSLHWREVGKKYYLLITSITSSLTRNTIATLFICNEGNGDLEGVWIPFSHLTKSSQTRRF
jgi:hypothetical protein